MISLKSALPNFSDCPVVNMTGRHCWPFSIFPDTFWAHVSCGIYPHPPQNNFGFSPSSSKWFYQWIWENWACSTKPPEGFLWWICPLIAQWYPGMICTTWKAFWAGVDGRKAMGDDKLGKLDVRDLISNRPVLDTVYAPFLLQPVKVMMLKIASIRLVSAPISQYFHLFWGSCS